MPQGPDDGPTRPLRQEPGTPTRRLSAAVRGTLADTRPLRTPAYRRLWSAGIVTVVGAQLTVVAVPTQIYQLTGSSAYVGLTGLFGLVPLVLFGLWGGAIADAVDRRVLLLLTGSGIAADARSILWVDRGDGRRRGLAGAEPVRRAVRVPRGEPARPAARSSRASCPPSYSRRPTR